MKVIWTVVGACAAAAAIAVAVSVRRAPFDTRGVADAEARMWRASYSGETHMISPCMEEMLRGQFGIEPYPSQAVARRMAIASMRFRSVQGGYETNTLPFLTEAYRVLSAVSGLAFNPREAARAELAWWMARRSPGTNSVEVVGDSIANLYRTLYGGDHPSFATAGRLRAEAAALRDANREKTDWHQVRALLRRSYAELGKAARTAPRTDRTPPPPPPQAGP
jgi:hypothetical protein